MRTNSSNSSISNLVILASISSSVISLSYDDSGQIIPEMKADYETRPTLSSNDWKDMAFNPSTDYSLLEDSQHSKIQTVLKFSTVVINNSRDIDSEYVDIVNENFWDLL